MALLSSLAALKLRSVSYAACGCLLIFLAGCEPPGKPKIYQGTTSGTLEFGALYTQNCEACHGVEGHDGPGRILNDPLYLAILPPDTLRQILIYGRPGTAMPAWAQSQGGPLTPKQIDAMVTGIYKSWAKPVNFGSTPPPPYAEDVKGNPDAGRKLFARNCFMCHAHGGPVGPLTGADYLSLVSNQMLRTSILIGRPDLGMADYRHLKLGKALSDQDVSDLVAFLASKRPPNYQDMQHTQGPAGGSTSASGTHAIDAGNGHEGPVTKGSEGSGFGPGSPTQKKNEGNKFDGGSSRNGVK